MSTMQEERVSGPVLPPGRVRRSFPREFKADAVALVLDEGRSIASVARSLKTSAGSTSRSPSGPDRIVLGPASRRPSAATSSSSGSSGGRTVLALISPGTAWGVALGVIVAVNSVIALYYYARIASHMWVEAPPESADFDTTTPIKTPTSVTAALVLTGAATLAFGILPQWVGHFTDVTLVAALAG